MTQPKSGPNAKSPDSKNQQRLALRTKDKMTPAMIAKRDLYIEGLLLGLPKYQAAIYSGTPARSAHKEGSNMFCEPYVQERFRELRQAMEEDQLLDRKELILNVKSIAFDSNEQSGPRVSACSLLTKLFDWEPKPVSPLFDLPLTINLVAKLPEVKDA